MAIIYSYPLNDDIKPLDELVGTTEKSINGQLKTVTRNFLLQDLAEFFIVDGGLQKEIILTTNNISGPATLDQVTGILNIPRYDQGAITPAALTKVNDTNVTLTLGGSPSNALLQDVSLTLGWTGTLADSRIASASIWNAKQNAITTGTNLQYLRGDLSLATFPTNISSFTNDSGYITNSALIPYITNAAAAATYEPKIIAGTTAQYWRGDKSWQTFPTIPTVGTWGTLNYPTWTTGTPFVKMTATGTFSLDTTIYEPALGNPTVNGYVLSSTTTGVRSWVAQTGGSGSSPLTTKGDLYTFSTVDARLPIGTDGQILTANSSVPEGLSWQDNYADWTSVVKHIVKNNGLSGTITKGTAVYVTSSNGTNMLVGKASNVSEPTSSKTMGLMQSDITTTGGTQTGFVITEGLLGGLNTDGATAGDPVWLGVDGALIYGLINKPYAPNHLVFIGIVTKVSAGNGEIFVKVQNGFELKELHDVQAQNPTLKDTLYYDNTVSPAQWKTASIPTVLGYTPQDTLQNTVNIKSINGNSILGSGDLTINPSTPSQSAFTILANNTNASAVPAEQVYKEVAQQSLSGTGMIATGGALPTGTNTHFYRWSQVGNLITVRINLQFQTAGTCSGIAIPFANMPDIPQIPQHPNIYATALDMITFGSGSLAANKLIGTFTVGNGMSGIRIKTIGTPNTYEIVVGRASGSYNNGWIHVQYYI